MNFDLKHSFDENNNYIFQFFPKEVSNEIIRNAQWKDDIY